MPRCSSHGTQAERETAWAFDQCPYCMAAEINRLRAELAGTKEALSDVRELMRKYQPSSEGSDA